VRLPILLATLLAGAGCGGDMVCIQWSEAEGTCPSRKDAIKFMAPPCDEPITSIDSEGDFDGVSCCYDVTKKKLDACEGQFQE